MAAFPLAPGQRHGNTTLVVELNGTDENPYHRLGLTQNPFPQIAEYGLAGLCLKLQSLGGDPVPDETHIRGVLAGWGKDFVDLCCVQFKRGEYVRFTVSFTR
jgi:hypothetical protein